MSVWTTVELQMNDAGCIVAALKEMGYDCEQHETPQVLSGYGGYQRDRLANIIVRQGTFEKGMSWGDAGLLKNKDGTYSLVSDFKYGRQGSFLQKLKQLYGKHRVIKQAKRMGYSVASTRTLDDGRIKVKIRC
jgi:hypothetical protein